MTKTPCKRKKVAAAGMSLVFSMGLSVLAYLVGVFLGNYRLPIKAYLACAIVLALLLFVLRAFEGRRGFVLLIALCALWAGLLIISNQSVRQFKAGG